MFVDQEHQLDKVLRHQIATLLGRILWLHPPISVLMRQIYADALTHVSMQHQKWQLIEHLFRCALIVYFSVPAVVLVFAGKLEVQCLSHINDFSAAFYHFNSIASLIISNAF